MLKPFAFLAVTAIAGAVAAGAALAPHASANDAPSALIESNVEPAAVAPAVVSAASSNDCSGAGFQDAALHNAASLQQLAWSPFGRAEKGWAIYQQHVARDIGTACDAGGAGFAAALAHWQEDHNLPASGEATVQTLTLFKTRWQDSRPYVALRATGVCPNPPADSDLTTLSLAEGYKGKSVQLKTEVAEAYRQMVAAARAEVPDLAADPEMLTVFSGYRSPAYDAARCARDHNCGGAERATCSVHRTGTAFDLDVGSAPGFPVDSSADANRLYQSRTAAYRWLVANADRFGFINYAFEPWHWEFVGAAPVNNPVNVAKLASVSESAR